MGIIASSKKDGADRGPFELCPEGPQQAVCCDVVDHGMVTTTWGGKPKTQHKITIRWQSQKKMGTGKPYLVQKRYTLSLHEKATLRRDLEMWRGRPFDPEQALAFDLEHLLGINAYLNVGHVKKPKGIYAEVMSLMPVPQATAKLTVTHYKRVKDRTDADRDAAQEPAPDEYAEMPAADESEKPPF
jgi:hypothetical protein